MKDVILVGLIAFGVSCSNSDRSSYYVGSSAGAGGSSGHAGAGGHSGSSTTGGETGDAGEGGTGATGGGDVTSALAPEVTITTPVEATDPNVDPVLIADQVTVLCTAKASVAAGAKAVSPASVKIAMFDSTGAALQSLAGTPTANVDEYSAPFVLTAVPSGAVSFKCTADDTASPVNHASATVNTLVDRGPDITVVAPVKDSAHNLLGPVDVEFTVAASPITSKDKQADVSNLTLTVGGTAITTTDKGGGAYQASVDFNDKKLFPSPPTGTIPVVIAATNKRSAPGKATNTLTYTFVLDGAGPVVTFTSPVAGAVIGRASVLAFTAVDAGSGVDNPTLTVTLNDVPHLFSTTDGLWTSNAATGAYTFKMGTQLASDSTDTQVTVDVNVRDKATNPATGNSRVFKLDTQPPTVDMDPPSIYLTRPGATQGTLQCSDYFDPLGAFAPNDLSNVANFGQFRALVWDQPNHKFGQDIYTYALTDQSSVRLYAQTDTTKPLLHDETGPNGAPDGICDEIWTGTPPEQKNPNDTAVPFVALTALLPTGETNWGVSANPPTDAVCQAGAKTQPGVLCGGHSDMSLVIHHPVVTVPKEPVVYAFQPVADPQSLLCAGDEWDISTIATSMGITKLGWICLAVRAVDTVGNPGVSAPLRVCLVSQSNPNACQGVPPPSCTDNCTAPAHFTVPANSQN